MAEKSDGYVCSDCGKRTVWKLQTCANCGGNSIIPFVQAQSVVAKNLTNRKPEGSRIATPRPITQVTPMTHSRITTSISELDRVLGGGIVPGSVILIGGEPGIGKSTILMMTANNISHLAPVLYISAEESEQQLALRAERLGVRSPSLYVVFESSVEAIMNSHIPAVKPGLVIVDSINTIFSDHIDSSAGSVKQIKHCETQLRQFAKLTGTPVILVGQVTKEGEVRGSSELSHDVDTVLYLEGDQNHIFRLLRAQKNRFGNVMEVGIFSMESSGLIEVPNPSEAFLAERQKDASGSSVAVTMEGDRPILVELQALVALGSGGNPARRANGVNRERIFMITSVLDKVLPYVSLFEYDLYVNVVGGMKIGEPAIDLSLAAAICSSFHEIPTPHDVVTIGEIGLTGEIRSVPRLELRLREAKMLGFKKAVVPQLREVKAPKGLEVVQVKTVDEALRSVFGALIDYDAQR